MSEAAFWGTIQKHLKREGHMERIENAVKIGTPDVNVCFHGAEGWLELKWAHRWPPKGGILHLDHYTQQQRIWGMKRAEAGGRYYLFLQIEKEQEYFLFKADKAAQYVGLSPREVLIRESHLHHKGGFPKERFLEVFSRLPPVVDSSVWAFLASRGDPSSRVHDE